MFMRRPERTEGDATAEKRETKAKLDIPQPAPAPAAKPTSYAKGSSQMVPSVISEDLTVTGNVISKGEVQVDGEVQGDVHCASLVVGDKAQITGNIVAEDVVVRGRVTGSVRGQRVTLQASSQVEGDIYHQSLAIEQGAFFEGKSRRSDDPTASAKATTPAKGDSTAGASSGGSGSGSGSGQQGQSSGGQGNTASNSSSPRAAE